MRLEGKTVLIAGGRSLGAAIARALAARGMRIVLTYRRSAERTLELVEELRKAGASAHAVSADLTNPSDVRRAVAEPVTRFGSLDVLVNLVSTFVRTPLADLALEEVGPIIADNLTAPLLVSVEAARQMRRPGPQAAGPVRGKIILFGDWASERPYRDHLPYLAAKGGVATLTAALARELAPDIHVNAICPALVNPPAGWTSGDVESVRRAIPVQAVGSPADVVALTLFLLEGTDFATGACYRLDGGRFLTDAPDAPDVPAVSDVPDA